MNLNQNVTCPNCSHSFHLEEVFLKNLQNNLEEKYKAQNLEKEKEIQSLKEIAERNEISKHELENSFKLKLQEAENQKQNEIKLAIQNNELQIKKDLEEAKNSELKTEKIKLKNQLENENQELINKFRSEAEKANLEIQKAKQLEFDNYELKKQLENQRIDIEIELAKKKEIEIEEKMQLVAKREAEKFSLELNKLNLQIADRDYQLKSVRSELDDAKRKADQGSMQLQGETLELLFEKFLKDNFRKDNILPVPKGQTGADIIQEVINQDEVCGKIIYELKRAKTFNKKEWIDKLKQEQINSKSDIAILITETMPEEETKVMLLDGVWVCHSSSFEGLVLAMRDSIIRIDKEKNSQANKGEKALELYDYLISTEFNLQIISIVDAFTSLKNGIEKERNAMERIWKEREKQIEKVTKNTIGIYGSLRGIAGSAIKNVKELDFDDDKIESKDSLQLGF